MRSAQTNQRIATPPATGRANDTIPFFTVDAQTHATACGKHDRRYDIFVKTPASFDDPANADTARPPLEPKRRETIAMQTISQSAATKR